MTNTISPVTDTVYRFPGGYEQVASPDTSLAARAAPAGEGGFVAPEPDSYNDESIRAAYADAMAAAAVEADNQLGVTEQQLATSATPTPETPIYDTLATERQARLHNAEALTRAAAFTASITGMRDHALTMEGAEPQA